MTDLNNFVNTILDEELNKDTKNKLINYVDKDINFKYNSFNICIGKKSTGKTTSVLKELIKLSLKDVKNYNLIILVEKYPRNIGR